MVLAVESAFTLLPVLLSREEIACRFIYSFLFTGFVVRARSEPAHIGLHQFLPVIPHVSVSCICTM